MLTLNVYFSKKGSSQDIISKNPFPTYLLLRTEASQIRSCVIGIAIKHLVGADNVQKSKRPLKPKRVVQPARRKVGKAFKFSCPNKKCGR